MEHKKIVDEVVNILGASVSGTPNDVNRIGKWLLATFSVVCIPLSFAAIILIKSGLLIYLGMGAVESWVLWCLSALPIIGLLLFKPVWNNQVGGTGFFVLMVKLLIILSWLGSVLFISSYFILNPGTGIEATGIKLIVNKQEIPFDLARSVILVGLSALITLAPLVISDRIFPNLSITDSRSDSSEIQQLSEQQQAA